MVQNVSVCESIIEETDDIGKSVFHGAGGITVLKAEIIAVMGIELY